MERLRVLSRSPNVAFYVRSCFLLSCLARLLACVFASSGLHTCKNKESISISPPPFSPHSHPQKPYFLRNPDIGAKTRYRCENTHTHPSKLKYFRCSTSYLHQSSESCLAQFASSNSKTLLPSTLADTPCAPPAFSTGSTPADQNTPPAPSAELPSPGSPHLKNSSAPKPRFPKKSLNLIPGAPPNRALTPNHTKLLASPGASSTRYTLHLL